MKYSKCYSAFTFLLPAQYRKCFGNIVKHSDFFLNPINTVIVT